MDKRADETPDWIRKAAISAVIADLLRGPDEYLTREFGLQSMAEHIMDLTDRLFTIATEGK